MVSCDVDCMFDLRFAGLVLFSGGENLARFYFLSPNSQHKVGKDKLGDCKVRFFSSPCKAHFFVFSFVVTVPVLALQIDVLFPYNQTRLHLSVFQYFETLQCLLLLRTFRTRKFNPLSFLEGSCKKVSEKKMVSEFSTRVKCLTTNCGQWIPDGKWLQCSRVQVMLVQLALSCVGSHAIPVVVESAQSKHFLLELE